MSLLSSFSSSSVFLAISLGFTILHHHLRSQLYLRFTILLHQLCSQLYLWGSAFFIIICVLSYISGVHHSSSASLFPAVSLGFTILGETLEYVAIPESNYRGSRIPSLWMVHAGCVFVASIHRSRPWNTCVLRLDSVYSLIQKNFVRMESELILTSREKFPLTEAQRRVEHPMPLLLDHGGSFLLVLVKYINKAHKAIVPTKSQTKYRNP